MIIYVLYEAEFHTPEKITIITASTLARKYGLKKDDCKVVKLNRPQDEPVNTNKIAYIHLYPQINESNYDIIKKYIINV